MPDRAITCSFIRRELIVASAAVYSSHSPEGYPQASPSSSLPSSASIPFHTIAREVGCCSPASLPSSAIALLSFEPNCCFRGLVRSSMSCRTSPRPSRSLSAAAVAAAAASSAASSAAAPGVSSASPALSMPATSAISSSCEKPAPPARSARWLLARSARSGLPAKSARVASRSRARARIALSRCLSERRSAR